MNVPTSEPPDMIEAQPANWARTPTAEPATRIQNVFEGTVAALATYAAAGAIAGKRVKGPGFLPQELCDALYALDLAGLKANAAIRAV